MDITGEQLQLLEAIVDAYWTRVSESTGQKIDFTLSTKGGSQGSSIEHPGLPSSPFSVDFGDLDELIHKGLVRLRGTRPKSGTITPTAEGRSLVEAKRQVEAIVRADRAISPGGRSGIGWDDTLSVLQAIVDLYPDAPPGLGVQQRAVNERLERGEDDLDTSRKFEMLEQAGYVKGFLETDQVPGPLMAAPTEKALKLLAGWPADGAIAVERLLVALQARIDASADEEEKGKLRNVMDSVLAIGQELAADVLAKVITG